VPKAGSLFPPRREHSRLFAWKVGPSEGLTNHLRVGLGLANTIPIQLSGWRRTLQGPLEFRKTHHPICIQLHIWRFISRQCEVQQIKSTTTDVCGSTRSGYSGQSNWQATHRPKADKEAMQVNASMASVPLAFLDFNTSRGAEKCNTTESV